MNPSENQDLTVQDDTVVTLDYTLTVEGEIIEQSKSSGAIQFIQGRGEIVPGLENALYGMRIGDSKQVSVPPEEGYGEEDRDAYAEIPRREFPADFPLEVGVELQLRDEDGDVLEAYIQEVGDDFVLLNFNHHLAGKTLDFSISVADLRLATLEEMVHGHAHTEEE
jgi:FKBP-type peptidyl-prolyl cis-trans isomerase SlyD